MKIIVADTETIQARVGTLLEKELLPVIRRRGAAILGLPGGRSVAPIIEVMPKLSIPWDRVSLFFVDERWLPREDSERNETGVVTAINTAFESAPVRPRIVAAPAADSTEDPSEGARNYANTLKSESKGTLHFDVAILGIGEDGHIASIFPGSPLRLEEDAAYVSVKGSPKPPATRITANASLLTSTPCVVGLLFGGQKSEAYRRLTSGESAATLPAAMIREAPRGYIFADYPAAGGTMLGEAE